MLKFAEIFKVIQRRREGGTGAARRAGSPGPGDESSTDPWYESPGLDSTTAEQDTLPEVELPEIEESDEVDELVEAADEDTDRLIDELKASGDELALDDSELPGVEGGLDFDEAADLLGDTGGVDSLVDLQSDTELEDDDLAVEQSEMVELPGTESAGLSAEPGANLDLDSGELTEGMEDLAGQELDLSDLAAELDQGEAPEEDLDEMIREVRDGLQPSMGTDTAATEDDEVDLEALAGGTDEGPPSLDDAAAELELDASELAGLDDDGELDLEAAMSGLDDGTPAPPDDAVGIDALLSDDSDQLGSGPSSSENVDEGTLADAVQDMGEVGDEVGLEQLPEQDEAELGPGAPGFIQQMADMIQPEEDQEASQDESDEDELDADKLAMDVDEAAKLLEIDETEASLAIGDGEVEDVELMKQVREEANRLAEQVDDGFEEEPLRPLEDEDDEDTAPVVAGAGGAMAVEATESSPSSRRHLRGGLAGFLYVTNYLFEKFNVSEETRTVVGYTAVAAALILLVLLAVMFLVPYF